MQVDDHGGYHYVNQNLIGRSNQIEQVWILINDKKGELCFYNKISGEVRRKKPIGMKLGAREKELWEDFCKRKEKEDE